MTSYLDLLKQHVGELRQAPQNLYDMLVEGMQEHAREDVAPMFERMNQGSPPTLEQLLAFAQGPYSPLQMGAVKSIEGIPTHLRAFMQSPYGDERMLGILRNLLPRAPKVGPEFEKRQMEKALQYLTTANKNTPIK